MINIIINEDDDYEFLLSNSTFLWAGTLMPVCPNMKALSGHELNKLYEI